MKLKEYRERTLKEVKGFLEQPYARKTHVPALDESCAYCFQQSDLLNEIRYEVVFQDEWEKRLNDLLAEH